jgi:hypothetical protein
MMTKLPILGADICCSSASSSPLQAHEFLPAEPAPGVENTDSLGLRGRRPNTMSAVPMPTTTPGAVQPGAIRAPSLSLDACALLRRCAR